VVAAGEPGVEGVHMQCSNDLPRVEAEEMQIIIDAMQPVEFIPREINVTPPSTQVAAVTGAAENGQVVVVDSSQT
jgi:hypothetical protein